MRLVPVRVNNAHSSHRSKPDQGQDFWVKVYAEPKCDKATDGGTIIGELHVNITYKTFKVRSNRGGKFYRKFTAVNLGGQQ